MRRRMLDKTPLRWYTYLNKYRVAPERRFFMNMYTDIPTSDERVAVTVFIFYGILLLGALLFWLAGYLFQAMGTYTLAKKQNLPSPFLAFIPYARTYLLGELAGEINIGKRKMRSPGLWLLLLPILLSLLLAAVIIAYIVSIFITSFSMMHKTEEEIFLAVFGVILLWVVVLVVVSIAVQTVTYWITLLVRVNIFKKYTEENLALTHGILSLFIPLYAPIYLFILSRKAPEKSPEPIIPAFLPEEILHDEEN